MRDFYDMLSQPFLLEISFATLIAMLTLRFLYSLPQLLLFTLFSLHKRVDSSRMIFKSYGKEFVRIAKQMITFWVFVWLMILFFRFFVDLKAYILFLILVGSAFVYTLFKRFKFLREIFIEKSYIDFCTSPSAMMEKVEVAYSSGWILVMRLWQFMFLVIGLVMTPWFILPFVHRLYALLSSII